MVTGLIHSSFVCSKVRLDFIEIKTAFASVGKFVLSGGDFLQNWKLPWWVSKDVLCWYHFKGAGFGAGMVIFNISSP